MSNSAPALVWFRHDLRVADNPALHAAAQSGQPVLAVYIYDTQAERPLGAASEWWLHHSLTELEKDFKDCGAKLQVLKGNPSVIIPSLVQDTGAKHVFWNRRYDTYGIEIDTGIKESLTEDGVDAKSFKGNLIIEPWEMKTGSGNYYKVFTPFWKSSLKTLPPSDVLPAPKDLKSYDDDVDAIDIDALNLLPTKPDWSGGFTDYFTPGSDGAKDKLALFLDKAVYDYDEARNLPAVKGTSKLSPHLAFGEISPRQIWHATKATSPDEYTFLSEIGWREFSYNLLYHNPKLANENFKPAFDAFTWEDDPIKLKAWQRGQTGYPIVDAGMRELWHTGWQHNRVRMITASFLIKHLRIDWRKGEAWFWDCLVDADPASNSASWQWVAGSGADASPYFRIFNPFTQGQKFDKEGDYVRKWVPELGRMPKKFIHTPWEAPKLVLLEAGVTLGKSYPRPIVDHKEAREKALAAYAATKTDNG